MKKETAKCPVCGPPDTRRSVVLFEDSPYLKVYQCKLCGDLAVSNDDESDYLLEAAGTLRRGYPREMLSALLRERTIKGLPPTWLQFGARNKKYARLERSGQFARTHIEELLQQAPMDVPEKIERSLCNLGRQSRDRGGHIMEVTDDEQSLFFAVDQQECTYIMNALIKEDFVEHAGTRANQTRLRLTPRGWERFGEITRGGSLPTNPAFVAMPFGEEGTENRTIFDNRFSMCMLPAINNAGYRAKRSDSARHNTWIMNQILGDIRAAPFVVADLTGCNPGVCFEAGFARGLGVTVIHTCQKDNFRDVHFDISQIECLIWDTPEHLAEKLTHWIRASVGVGPYRRDELNRES